MLRMEEERREGPAVERQAGPEQRAVLGDPAPVGARIRDHQPRAHAASGPAAAPRDLNCQPPLLVERPDQLIDIDDRGLEFDDQNRAGRFVPSQQVDDSSLAVDLARRRSRTRPRRQRPSRAGARSSPRRLRPTRHAGRRRSGRVRRRPIWEAPPGSRRASPRRCGASAARRDRVHRAPFATRAWPRLQPAPQDRIGAAGAGLSLPGAPG